MGRIYITAYLPSIISLYIAGNIRAMELVMVDPGTVVGPNYSSKPICIECLHPGMIFFQNNIRIVYQSLKIICSLGNLLFVIFLFSRA